jgi:hypothetical protein
MIRDITNSSIKQIGKSGKSQLAIALPPHPHHINPLGKRISYLTPHTPTYTPLTHTHTPHMQPASTPPSRETLLCAAQSLCGDFSAGCPTAVLLSHFATTLPPTAIEHGHPDLAPFLGRSFLGRDEVARYFDMIASLLTFENMRFSDYVIDTDILSVSCKGQARFTWKETNQCWDEVFTYTLNFVEEGPRDAHREVRVRKYQVWADTGALWLASQGKLEELEREKRLKW